VKLFVSTNKNNIIAKILLKKLKIIKYFKYIVGFNTYKYKKPNPLHLKAICKKFNLKKEEILYIGDTEIDSIMANKYRVKFALITNGYTTLHPDRISYDFLTSDYKRLYKTLRIKKLIA
jgi:phosphoglycolate phosphatase